VPTPILPLDSRNQTLKESDASTVVLDYGVWISEEYREGIPLRNLTNSQNSEGVDFIKRRFRENA